MECDFPDTTTASSQSNRAHHIHKRVFRGVQDCLFRIQVPKQLPLDLQAPFLHHGTHLHTQWYFLESYIHSDHLHSLSCTASAGNTQAESAASDCYKQAVPDQLLPLPPRDLLPEHASTRTRC